MFYFFSVNLLFCTCVFKFVLFIHRSPVKPATVLEAKLPDEFTDYMTDGVLKTTDIDDMPPYIPEYNQNGGQYTTYNESLPQTWSKQGEY